MRHHPVLLSVFIMMLLGSTWFFLFQTAEKDKYDGELGFDLVRLLSAVHSLHQLERKTDGTQSGLVAQRQQQWFRIRFILSRWEPEIDPRRREIIKLMKRAVTRAPGFDNDYMQQYSGRIVMTDIGERDEAYPLYAAAVKIINDNTLDLSAEEKQRLAAFVDTTFTLDLESVRHATPDTLAQGQEEEMVAAYIIQNVSH